MRKAPKESATKFKVGTVMKGQDDLSYYVLKDKNNRKRWVKGSTLFVVYNYVYEKNKDFRWPEHKYASGWFYVGSGGTSDLKYPRETQFSGNPKYTKKMREYLKSYYNKLKSKKIISNYKIVTPTTLVKKYM